MVARDGEVLGVSWGAGRGVGKGDGMGDFDLLVEGVGVRPVFERGGKGKGGVLGTGEEGEGEKDERTLLQRLVRGVFEGWRIDVLTFLGCRYWWVLIGVAVLALSGGGDK